MEQRSEDNPIVPKKIAFATTAKEFVFGILILVIACLLVNSVFYAGMNLGFAIFSVCAVLCSTGYLLRSGHRLTSYSAALLILTLVICSSFARSDDGFVKFVLFCFLVVGANLGLCLLSGQNRRKEAGIASLLDVPRTVFMLGLGQLAECFRGLRIGFQRSGTAGKKGGAVLLGLLIAIPLLAIVIPLLISADAAFDALLQQLPDWELGELIVSVIFGSMLAVYLYCRAVALHRTPKSAPDTTRPKGINPITVNTVLIAIGVVYVVYLVSQLAYFSGGFSGILPEDYTLAQYARRGFFEMAWLCAINLGVIALAVGLVKKTFAAPLLTRLICLFLGIVTLFFAVSASAKLFLYIDGYGLTRLRVLTQVIILFLGISTIAVCLWLFLPKLAYMKVVLLTALVLGAVVGWADVDTVVAAYNVSAYQSGALSSIDVEYLDSLGTGAIPYIARLTEDADPVVAEAAKNALEYDFFSRADDFRDWNWTNASAQPYIRKPDNTK